MTYNNEPIDAMLDDPLLRREELDERDDPFDLDEQRADLDEDDGCGDYR